MANTQTRAWLDQEDAKVAQIIRRHGWFVQYVSNDECDHPECSPGDGPPFAYTVGLFGLGHPELLIFGVPRGTAAGVLNDLGERIRSGDNLIAGQLVTFSEWPHRIVPEGVPNPGEIVFAANRHYCRPDEHSVPVLQLSYDDKAGRFPWEDGYTAPEMQPRPGTFSA
jgi:hypothetical protein